jgi:hypothetical protein
MIRKEKGMGTHNSKYLAAYPKVVARPETAGFGNATPFINPQIGFKVM